MMLWQCPIPPSTQTPVLNPECVCVTKHAMSYYMFLVARSLCVSPFLMRWYIPREIWLAMKTRSWVVSV